MGTETCTTAKLLKSLNSLSSEAKFINKEAKLNRGHPDIMGCVKGRMILIENKTPNYWKRKPGHALQLNQLEKWKKAGALVYIPKTDEERAELVEKIKFMVSHSS